MGQELNFYEKFHNAHQRKYLERANDPNRAENIRKAKFFDKDYWDGDRSCGYGGYHYNGSHFNPAVSIAWNYSLTPTSSVLDIGCGKGHLLYELQNIVHGLYVAGLDVSQYALNGAPAPILGYLKQGVCWNLPYKDNQFDLVLAVNLLHNIPIQYVEKTLHEINRVSKKHKWVLVESWRTEEEKINFLNWQLTAESFHSIDGWKWLFQQAGYDGDYGFEVHQ